MKAAATAATEAAAQDAVAAQMAAAMGVPVEATPGQPAVDEDWQWSHVHSCSEASGVERYEASQGHTSKDIAVVVTWANYEGFTWSQLRARNAKVWYTSIRRMGPNTASTKRLKRLKKLGHENVLVDCFTIHEGVREAHI